MEYLIEFLKSKGINAIKADGGLIIDIDASGFQRFQLYAVNDELIIEVD